MENLLHTLVNKIHTIIWRITNVVITYLFARTLPTTLQLQHAWDCSTVAQNVDSSNSNQTTLLPLLLSFTTTYPVTYTTLLQDLNISDAPYETLPELCGELHRTPWRGVGLELPALQAGFRQDSLPKHVVSKSADVWLDGSDQFSLNLSILHVIN